MRTMLKLKSLIPIGISALILAAATFATVQAAYPTFWTQWVVANASITPSPQPTGFAGPVAVAQVTAAPTQQPYNVDVAGLIANAGTSLAAQSGTNGPVAVAQATSAPTPQSGYLDVTHMTSTFFNANAGTGNNNFQWACGTVSTLCAFGQNASATISSISCTVLGLNNGTNNTANSLLCMDAAGNLGIGGSFTANSAIRSAGAIVGGNGSAPTCASGDGCFSRSTTTGQINLGGTSTKCSFDFGTTTSATGTISCPLNVTGATAVTGSFNYSTPAPGCTSNSGLPCGAVVTCTTSSAVSCAIAFTVPAAGAQCTASYDSQTHGAPSAWLPIFQTGSGSTSRSWTGTFTTSQSNAIFIDYHCV